MVAEGTFREDLYYRLHVVEVRMPALREQRGGLCRRSSEIISSGSSLRAIQAGAKRGVSREALRRLSVYAWPGNVRQLEHVLLNASLMMDGDGNRRWTTSNSPPRNPLALPRRRRSKSETSRRGRRRRERGKRSSPRRATETEFKDVGAEKRILSALEACSWNRVRAAQMVGLPRRTLYRRLKEFGIQ